MRPPPGRLSHAVLASASLLSGDDVGVAAMLDEGDGLLLGSSKGAMDTTSSASPIARLNDDHNDRPSASSPRHVRRRPPPPDDPASAASSAIQSLTSASTLSSGPPAALDLSSPFFPAWRDAAAVGLPPSDESAEEMQRNDPLGTQMWKLYHKTKAQLPNAERLENLTWRMMSMNLRRKELARQQGCVPSESPRPRPLPSPSSLPGSAGPSFPRRAWS